MRSSVLELLSDPTVRLAVITAAAGCGKKSHAAAFVAHARALSRGSTSR